MGLTEIRFQIWGSRGGRNTYGSRIGNLTSCYSVRANEDLYVFDAGRGLLPLADAVVRGAIAGVKRVHVLVTHGHMDHWEGLKDATWMWARSNGLGLDVIGPAEALDAIRAAHSPPSFVPLEALALGTLAQFQYVELAANATHALPGATLRTVELHHYSGMSPDRRYLETVGFQLALHDGPTVAYLSDHEPTDATRAIEDRVVGSSHLAVIDANYGGLHEHAFGHGSIEYAAALARRQPGVQIVAAHHGPLRTDEAIEASFAQHAVPNLRIATEGLSLSWDPGSSKFV